MFQPYKVSSALQYFGPQYIHLKQVGWLYAVYAGKLDVRTICPDVSFVLPICSICVCFVRMATQIGVENVPVLPWASGGVANALH